MRTDCGGELMGLGGNMYMNNVTGLYDCFWIIKPLISLSFLKTHIYLKILAFEGDGKISANKKLQLLIIFIDEFYFT